MIPETSIKNLQKVADIYDLFDPAVDHILTQKLRALPVGASRRSWEFSMIYLALHNHGALHPESRGLGLGAGTELLIYALTEAAGSLTVTDLYGMEKGWKGVQTSDPLGLLREHAPWPVDFEKLSAHAMDMREITYPDESFDFAWSTGSFEHIGDDEDFDLHLREVHRVLKPGGVYAFTTVVNYGTETDRIPHNYYFHPEHFADILSRSPLEALPEFDCAVRRNTLNRPTPESSGNYMFTAGREFMFPVVAYRRGVVNNANLAVLRKTDKKGTTVKAVGFEATRDWLWQEARAFNRRLWREPQQLRVEARKDLFITQPEHFPEGQVEFSVSFLGSIKGAQVELVSRAVGYPVRPNLEQKVEAQPRMSLAIQAASDRIYMLRIKAPALSDPADIVVRAHVSNAEPTSSAASASKV